MSLQTHLGSLSRRHADLEREIHEATQAPSVDDLAVAALKRRKLHLKDEIKRLQDGQNTLY